MKTIFTLLWVIVSISICCAKEKLYTASTPAGAPVRQFLSIAAKDSVDFVRWKLKVTDRTFELHCNFGVGKPGTNGFYDGGKKVAITGSAVVDGNHLQLISTDKKLILLILNANVLHVLDSKNKLMVGNGGWSYALNCLTPVKGSHVTTFLKKSPESDSVRFLGRTPCGIPGLSLSEHCYKLKWSLVFRADSKDKTKGTYKLWGSPWHKEGGRNGTWKILTGKDGKIIYQLLDTKGNEFARLLRLDENILFFIDANENLLVGDEDFSFSLNKG